MLEAILERCAGLDVHQETVVACVLTGPLDRAPKLEMRTFGTMTHELMELGEWLVNEGCTHVAMESTGIYWKSVWNVLEAFDLDLLLANAHHVKNLPGRKTDMKDAEWIAKLLRCGLIEGSFVPTEDIRDLRDLTRYRKKLVHDATSEKNRIHKSLQDANIKLTTHMSASGRLLLQKIVDGEVITMEFLETHMRGALKHKSPKLLQSLNGRLRKHHRDMIRFSWNHLMYLEQQIEQVEQDIRGRLANKQEAMDLLTSIPGINEQAASIIVAEIGTDMSAFKDDHHLAAWAGVTPGNHQSAGKKRTRARSGNNHLKAVLSECAWAASMTRNTRLSARYWNWVKRLGKKKALVALGHTLLRIVYHMLATKTPYKELGADYLEHFRQEREKRREAEVIRQLEAKGFTVSRPA
ncbi:IS110 family transposase [Paenibacillus sp. FSL W8-0187]|uniref:IS110 family transposase n=1 Tax=Paenibacillus sp. FSL W8-0187 TaxID=2921710 RepID=UPI0030D8102B